MGQLSEPVRVLDPKYYFDVEIFERREDADLPAVLDMRLPWLGSAGYGELCVEEDIDEIE